MLPLKSCIVEIDLFQHHTIYLLPKYAKKKKEKRKKLFLVFFLSVFHKLAFFVVVVVVNFSLSPILLITLAIMTFTIKVHPSRENEVTLEVSSDGGLTFNTARFPFELKHNR